MRALPCAWTAVLLLVLLAPAWALAPNVPLLECSDGIDNDGDGTTDHPSDPDCGSPVASLEAPADPYRYCPHPSSHAHSYVVASGNASLDGRRIRVGNATVFEPNTVDCDGDGVPGDYDGDWETGVGGAFFGYGPWADEPVCGYGLRTHGPTVTVTDLALGADVWFVIGALDGPVVVVDPMTGATFCDTTGILSCLTPPSRGTGTTCGAGGDGGYWVFLEGIALDRPGGATMGTIMA